MQKEDIFAGLLVSIKSHVNYIRGVRSMQDYRNLQYFLTVPMCDE